MVDFIAEHRLADARRVFLVLELGRVHADDDQFYADAFGTVE